MYLYHTTDRSREILSQGIKNKRKHYLLFNTLRRNIIDFNSDLKTFKAIYLFRGEQLECNRKQSPSNTIFRVNSDDLDETKLKVLNYDLYVKFKKTFSLCFIRKMKYKKAYWDSLLTFEDYLKLSDEIKDSYKAEFLYFLPLIPSEHLTIVKDDKRRK